MNDNIRGCLEDPVELWEREVCLDEVSKDVEGELGPRREEKQECQEPRCETLKTAERLLLQVTTHDPCDSDLSATLLDGRFRASPPLGGLVSAFVDGSDEQRGLHAARFEWVGIDASGQRQALVRGRMAGITNAGTHRADPFDDCQECYAPGFMEGRLCGRFVRAREERLVGCWVTAVYKFRFEPVSDADVRDVQGTIEGLIVCPCGDGAPD